MKTIFFLLFLLVNSSSYCQTETDLLSQLDAAKSDSDRVKVLIDLHNLFFKTDLEKSEQYTRQMLFYGKASGNPGWENKGYLGLARCARKRRQYDSVVHYDSLSLSCLQRTADPNTVFAAKLQLVRDFSDAVNPKKALPILQDCERYCEKTHDPAQIAKTQQSFGWYYVQINQNTKAVSYYYKALQAYTDLKDEYMIAKTKIFLVQSLMAIGRTDSIPALIFSALEFYKKSNFLPSQAYCYELLGQSYFINGNTAKGIENDLEAKHLYNISNNRVEEAIATIDLARSYLASKNFEKTETYCRDAQEIFTDLKYNLGLIKTKTLWGQFYAEKGDYDLSEQYFRDADKQAKELDFPDLQTDNLRYWAAKWYKQKKYAAGDSMILAYAEKVVSQREPAMIANELRMLTEKNKNIDSNKIRLLSLLYTPGGVEKFKKQLNKKSLSSVIGMDSLLTVNPFSFASATYDSAANIAYNKQLLDMESKYKTRLVTDSLHHEQEAALLAQQRIKNNNIILISIIAICLLLFAGFALQYRNRIRAERDKEKIQLLQNEIHHRVKNNLGVISRLVDIAGKNAVDDVPLSSLKTRIKSIELLHKHLYSEEAKTGNISLQSYLEDLCLAIAATFETGKDIRIQVNANTELESTVAEKVGLIVNELVTNSYKYAFQEKTSGTIHITAKRQDENNIEVAVQDDGVGFETGKNKSNYGMKLIRGLSHELNGQFSFSNNGGTSFQLSIPA